MERCFSINFLIHLTELKWRKFTCKYLRLHAGSIICFKPLPSINWQNLPIIAMSWTHPVTRKLVHPDARLFNYQIIQQQSQHKPALLLFSFYNSFAKKAALLFAAIYESNGSPSITSTASEYSWFVFS